MKTSVQFLLAAALVLLASLTAYNMALRAEYRSGAYKDPLHNYATLAFRNFTEVAVPAASALRVKIVAGPFGVRVHPAARSFVHVSQQGQRLVVAVAFPEQAESLGWAETVVISCPRLAALSTDATYQVKGQPHRDKAYADHAVVVQGFVQDSLALRQDRGSRIELAGNRLGFLRAVAGATAGSHPLLQLNKDNHIAAASLTMNHQSALSIDNVAIPRLRYHFGDSAQVTLTGAALGSVLK